MSLGTSVRTIRSAYRMRCRQSHHWDAPQCTVHPFVVYWRENGEGQHQSFCIISDNLKHNTTAVHAFQKALIPRLKEKIPSLTKIRYFSDGSAAQYKNRFNFSNICAHKSDFGLDCDRQFFATSHGKGACDGVGGTVKRATALESLRRPTREQITNATEMFEFLSDKFETTVNFVFVSRVEVEKAAEHLKERFSKAVAVKGTQSLHCFIPVNHETLRVSKLSGGPGRLVKVQRSRAPKRRK